ncbi:MAG: bifunctional precorrin-2 dehydrogenase/sirohydrochlorin ferrochelatase [Actinomycetota bacterium]|nr:bifunctional precorrin-2 dehydrogenase/sirohydrochlorin ferrochelatase [Actinomycetota bacterium]
MYPIFLDLTNRKCIVVGAGEVAERKINALLNAGADILVIGPTATAAIRQLAESGKVARSERDFIPGDLDGAFLVIAATDDRRTNELVYREAGRRGTLVNVVDAPELCNFFVPAVVERGRLKVAISTGGASPALAAKLRARFERELGPEYADYVEVIDDFRRRVIKRVADPAERKRAYERLFASDLLDQVKRGAKIDIETLVSKHAG